MTWASAIEASWLGVIIRQSTWLFAATEVVHLFGLTMLLGTTVVLNLRLLGAGMLQQSVGAIAADTRPWNTIGLALSLGSGALLFISEAVRMTDSGPFRVKMALLVVAVIYTYTVHRHATAVQGRPGRWMKASAALSLLLWFGVALAGRGIAFY